MDMNELTQDAVLRVGEVYEVDGRKVVIKVDKNKNLTDLFFNGDIIRNISVNSFIEIRKGFLSIIGKVDGERIQEQLFKKAHTVYDQTNKNERYLTVSLSGYIDRTGKFIGGMKELPLIGNEAHIVTRQKILQIHSLISDGSMSVTIADTEAGDIPIPLPVDGLFNSHIAIFGNTGSGKSNTLAHLYQELCKILEQRNPSQFSKNARFILFDFNGEYTSERCISNKKRVYSLSTRNNAGDKLPIEENSLLDVEMLSVLCSATDKTQKPFIRRASDFYKRVFDKEDPLEYFKAILRKEVKRILQMSDKIKTFQVLDYLRDFVPPIIENDIQFDIVEDLEWHNQSNGFRLRDGGVFLGSFPERIVDTRLYKHIDDFEFDTDLISRIISFLYLQLINDLLSNRAQNDHIAPAIGKLKSKQKDIDRIFDTSTSAELWESNFLVIDLSQVNLDMKKTIPLLLAKKVYTDHKKYANKRSLTIIIDEAHNILSKESFREAESWKDYRLETFEEIIKEGRKFGVFVTISSQRPNDISATITSQAHNYFIHRLVNQKDLQTISNAVSYLDKIAEESIPTLPTGMCIFSGVAGQMPLKMQVRELSEHGKPSSHTLKFATIVPDQQKKVGLLKSKKIDLATLELKT